MASKEQVLICRQICVPSTKVLVFCAEIDVLVLSCWDWGFCLLFLKQKVSASSLHVLFVSSLPTQRVCVLEGEPSSGNLPMQVALSRALTSTLSSALDSHACS